MLTSSETPIIASIVLVAFGILGWSFYRARPFGKLGILAWLQSVVLMAPWLLFFSLFAAGIYINIVGIIFLLVASSALYIFLGRQLRKLGQDTIVKQRITDRLAAEATHTESSTNGAMQPVVPASATEVLTIPEQDLNLIKGIFGIDTFFATETIAYLEGAVFRGNLRGDPETVHNRLSTSLEERLGNKYRLFIVENTDGKPVIIVLPSRNDQRVTTLPQKVFAVILLVATIVTNLEATGLLLRFDLFANPERLRETLPIGLSIFMILVTHEIGHWVQARRHQVRLSWPFFLPAVQIGSFGAITRFESVLSNRKILFDIALAGPATGGIVSFLILVTGLLLSHYGLAWGFHPMSFQLPSEFFSGSILVGTLARVILGSALQSPVVEIHPLVVIGWLGMLITALNLMPAGQLDGGRIVQAIYGRKIAGRTTLATLIVLGLVSLGNSLAMYWAIVIIFLQRDLERPTLNEISEPDDARAALGLLALFLMIATLLPLTPGLAGRLGIG